MSIYGHPTFPEINNTHLLNIVIILPRGWDSLFEGTRGCAILEGMVLGLWQMTDFLRH